MLSYIRKQNNDNVPLQELVEDTNERVDVNCIRNFGNNVYGNNYNNSYGRPPYAQNNYGNCPFITYPNANENK
jgi:hypothetical protein